MCVLLAVGDPPAEAGALGFEDAADTRGPLDVARISHGHRAGEKLSHAIKTHEPWRNRDLNRDASYFAVWLDLREGPQPERLIWIKRTRKRGLFAEMYRRGSGEYPWDEMTEVPAWRSSGRTVRVAFKRRWIGKARSSYRWRVTSSFERQSSGPCKSRRYVIADDVPPEGRCMDHAPNGLGYRPHHLRRGS